MKIYVFFRVFCHFKARQMETIDILMYFNTLKPLFSEFQQNSRTLHVILTTIQLTNDSMNMEKVSCNRREYKVTDKTKQNWNAYAFLTALSTQFNAISNTHTFNLNSLKPWHLLCRYVSLGQNVKTA